MERALEGDDSRPTGGPTGQFHGALDGLGARVTEEDGIERCRHRGGDRLGEGADRLDIAERVADVEQLVGLLLDGRGHAWVMVPEHGDSDATREVEVASPLCIEQAMTLAVRPGALEIARHRR